MCKDKSKFCTACIVTVEVATSGDTIQINNSAIQGKEIFGFQIRRGTGKTRMGKTLAAQTVLDAAHLSIKEGSQFRIEPTPVSWFQRDHNDNDPFCFTLKNLDSNSVEIKLDTTAAGFNATHAIEITFFLSCC